MLVNVDGTSDSMQNFGISVNGTTREKVLFNFSQATSLSISGIAVQGSILAPRAAVNFGNGTVNGTPDRGVVQRLRHAHQQPVHRLPAVRVNGRGQANRQAKGGGVSILRPLFTFLFQRQDAKAQRAQRV